MKKRGGRGKTNAKSAKKTGRRPSGPKSGSRRGPSRSDGRSQASRGRFASDRGGGKKARSLAQRRDASGIERIEGLLQPTGDGDFQVVPFGGSAVFVPREDCAQARPGDWVFVVARVGRKGRSKGAVKRVLIQAQAECAGQVLPDRSGSGWLLQPTSTRESFRLVLPKDIAAQLSDNAMALARFEVSESFEIKMQWTQTLGDADSPATRLRVAEAKHSLPETFSAQTMQEVAQFDEPSLADLKSEPLRQDLTALKHVTIDGEDARDFDDAVYAELEGGKVRVWVSIADVASYVRFGSNVDDDAIERTTSVYFPHRVIPMLPERLSNDLCSLRPDTLRRALTCRFDVDRKGGLSGVEVFPSLIKSHARLTYSQVTRHFEGRGQLAKLPAPLDGSLSALREASERIRTARLERGGIELDIPEAQVIIGPDGAPAHMKARQRLSAHLLIEDLMIAANEAVAEFCLAQNIDVLYRGHEPPSGDGLGLFQRWLKHLTISTKGVDFDAPDLFKQATEAALRIERERQSQLKALQKQREQEKIREAQREAYQKEEAERQREREAKQEARERGLDYIPKPRRRPPAEQEPPQTLVLRASAQTPPASQSVTHMLALRAMSQARYTPENLGHFGLASPAYLHFTSPIRRYPDLVVHRALWAHWQKKKPSHDFESLVELGEHCSTGERKAMQAERDVLRCMGAMLAENMIGQRFVATVVGVADFGVFVRPNDLFIEGFIPVERLLPERAFFDYVPEHMAMVAREGKHRYSLGDVLNVLLVGADLHRRRIEFALEGAEATGPRRRFGGAKSGKRSFSRDGRPKGPRREDREFSRDGRPKGPRREDRDFSRDGRSKGPRREDRDSRGSRPRGAGSERAGNRAGRRSWKAEDSGDVFSSKSSKPGPDSTEGRPTRPGRGAGRGAGKRTGKPAGRGGAMRGGASATRSSGKRGPSGKSSDRKPGTGRKAGPKSSRSGAPRPGSSGSGSRRGSSHSAGGGRSSGRKTKKS